MESAPSSLYQSEGRAREVLGKCSGTGLRQGVRRGAERLGAWRRLSAHPPSGGSTKSFCGDEDQRKRAAREVRLPARRPAIRRPAARRHRFRLRSHGHLDGRRRSDPRRHRLPEDAARPGPSHGRAHAGHRAAAARAAPALEEPAAVVRWLAAAVLACAASAFAFSNEIALKELPPEARQTLALIKAGGPFPYSKDGSPFGNREGLLPKRNREIGRASCRERV